MMLRTRSIETGRARGRRTALFGALAVSAALVYACGGGDGGSETVTTPPKPEKAGESGASASADGEAIFAQNCGSCHTLAAAGTNGAVGPNLDQLQLDQAEVQSQVTNGGGGMPAYAGTLSSAEIAAVSQYVAENAGK